MKIIITFSPSQITPKGLVVLAHSSSWDTECNQYSSMYKVMCKSDVLLVYLQVSVVLLLLLLQLVLQVCIGLGSAFWLAFQLLLLRD